MTSISRSIATGFLAVTFLIPALALAQASVAVPQTIGYQGRLLKSDGSPVTGTVKITFSIYDAETGTGPEAKAPGEPLWSETKTVSLSNGFYAVFLGSESTESAGTLANCFNGKDRWLGVKVGIDSELTPRQKIGSVAYAITATNAQHAVNADNAATATRATTAGSADTATNVSGGTVNATSGAFSGNVTIGGVLPGRVVGGGFYSHNYSSPFQPVECRAWGSAKCPSPTSPPQCPSGSTLHESGVGQCWTDTYGERSFCITYICVQ